MSLNKIYHGVCSKGVFVPDDPVAFKLCLCGNEGKRVDITVKRHVKKRSLNQNAYYHGVVLKIISDETGEDIDRVHDAMRLKFLREDGKIGATMRSTTTLDTKQMEDYLLAIRRWADDFFGGALYIPTPNEIDYADR